MKKIRIIIAVVITVLCWQLVSEMRPGDFSVVFFDIGQGDASLVTTPDHTTVLIDGGPSRAVLTKLGERLPWWSRSIDMVVLSHPHADHITGLIYVLERYRVGRVLLTDVIHTTPEYERFLTLVRDKHIPVTIAVAGQTFNLGGGVNMSVYWPLQSYGGVQVADLNNTSIVNKFVWQNTSVLFTGDTPAENEATILTSGTDLQAQILKVAHHGSRMSSSEDFLRAVKPEVAVISVGKDNQFGHPHIEVVERLKDLVASVYRTDQDGDVIFTSDGNTWQKR